jgi:sulfatase modifying factor 1
MKQKNILILAANAVLISSASAYVTMDWVTVGNAGNTADPLTGYGAVDHVYQIGKYEVTNAQYGEFLNAKGQSNANGIYNSNMSSYGISQAGSFGSYTYNVTGGLANRPVVYVSWLDAARFANWMMNGQGSGDTETGAYTLNNTTSWYPIITANAGAQVYIPSENEWYKAAYYNAATTSYSLYPNGRNTITTEEANYASGSSTDVGIYSGAPSSYGTFDQGGNVSEWNDAVIEGSGRGIRGGSWYDGLDDYLLPSTHRWSTNQNHDDFYNIGFRLASAIPEPTSLVLTMFASGVILIRRKR